MPLTANAITYIIIYTVNKHKIFIYTQKVLVPRLWAGRI